jgi:hypothetical protein
MMGQMNDKQPNSNLLNQAPQRKVNRRRFLSGAGAIGLVALLEACGLRDVIPTSGGTPASRATVVWSTGIPTASPTLTRGATATPGATASGTPTATGTPSPTGTPGATKTPTPSSTPAGSPTPSPTWTPSPTPTPTPYPPGPPSKLGLFVTRADGQINTLVQVGKPALIKTLNLDPNFGRYIKEQSPRTIVVGRIVLDQLDLTADPIPLARDAATKLLEMALDPVRLEYFDAWEAVNEPVADTPDKMKRLAEYEAERVRLLGEQGVRSVVGNFAAGHPPLELWGNFAPALDAARRYGGYLGLHEYSAPIMQWGSGALQPPPGGDEGDEGWLTLRYRKAYRHYLGPMGYGDVPLLITECGVDGTVGGRPGPPEAKGWRDFEAYWVSNGLRGDTPGVYMDQLIWYDGELYKDDYVKGAAIFAAGASPGWESFEILGRTIELLTQYMQVHPPR